VFQQVQVAAHAGRVTAYERHDRAAGVLHRCRCGHAVPRKASNVDGRVNCIAYWEGGKAKVQHCSWGTDLRVSKRTIFHLMRGRGRDLFLNLLPSGLTIRQWRGGGQRFHSLDLRVPAACHLGGGLGSGVGDPQGMEGQREGRKPRSVLALACFPALPLRVGGLHVTCGLGDGWIPRRPSLVPLKSVLGLLPLLAGLPPLPTHGERIPVHDDVHERKDSRHPQALQPWFGALDEGRRPVTDQGAPRGSQRFKPLGHKGFPWGG
jgi:hypothetical protein